MRRKFHTILLLFVALLLTLSLHACASQPVGVTIDGTAVTFTEDSGSPFISKDSRTLVPLRVVMEAYGCSVDWDNENRIAAVTLDGTTVRVPVGMNEIFIDDQPVTIDAAAQIKDGRTYLPIRAVLEAFGATVGWNPETRTVTVLHPEKSVLEVHFIDVGQADCILITTDEEAMLIDAGNNDDAETVTAYLRENGITNLKYLVGTHPHEDHIGSLDTVLYAVNVENVLMPKIMTNTKTFEDVLDAVAAKGLSITAPKAGDTYQLGCAVLTAVSDYTGDDLNNASIMLHMTYGNTTFLFTGDAEVDAEQAALQTGLSLDCDVLKVGHHGSHTSSSAEFLAATTPAHAVISCGKGNDYGHPHKETLDALDAFGAVVCRTDIQGTVIAVSDGTSITWSEASIPTLIKDGTTDQTPTTVSYVLNTNSMKFHYPSCESVPKISEKNRADSTQSRQSLIDAGYNPCGGCKP